MLSECFGGRHNEQDGVRFAADTADRMVDYLRWTGQNTLIYPAFFYQGPTFPTLAEDLITGGSERHPPEYLDILLRRFEEAGDSLYVSVTPRVVMPWMGMTTGVGVRVDCVKFGLTCIQT